MWRPKSEFDAAAAGNPDGNQEGEGAAMPEGVKGPPPRVLFSAKLAIFLEAPKAGYPLHASAFGLIYQN
jgi:hypothetical protein